MEGLFQQNIHNIDTSLSWRSVNALLSSNTYTAKFNKQDLLGVVAGDEVTLAVKGTFTSDGKVAQIQASDTVKVIK